MRQPLFRLYSAFLLLLSYSRRDQHSSVTVPSAVLFGHVDADLGLQQLRSLIQALIPVKIGLAGLHYQLADGGVRPGLYIVGALEQGEEFAALRLVKVQAVVLLRHRADYRHVGSALGNFPLLLVR